MRFVLFGTYDARVHSRIGIMAAGLRSAGFPVDECNEPTPSHQGDGTGAIRGLFHGTALAFRVLRAWLRMRRRLRDIATPDVVVVGHPGMLDVHLARRWWPTATLVLDYFTVGGDAGASSGFGGNLLRKPLDALDRSALRAADIVVVDTEEKRERLPPDVGSHAVAVPIGAEDVWFQPLREPVPGPLRVVMFGLYTASEGAPVVKGAIERCAGANIEFTMIGRGPGQPVAASTTPGTPVTWLDFVAAKDLPAIVATQDVALGLFSCKEKAQRVAPAKIFQAAAAGCAIVTAETTPQKRILGNEAVFIPCGDADSLAGTLKALAADPDLVAKLRRATHELAARDFTPAAIVQPLIAEVARRREAS